MAKASDNQFPYLHLVPAAAPANPAAGERLYLDSADGNKLKRRSTTGVVTTIEGGGGSGASPTTLWLGAADMNTAFGTPSLSVIGSSLPAWLVDAASVETVAGSVEIPADWATFHADVLWAPTTTGGGGVYLDAGQGFITPGSVWTSAYVATGGASTAPGVVDQVVERRLITSLARTGTVFGIRVIRVATNAADTYPNDAAILGVRFTKAS